MNGCGGGSLAQIHATDRFRSLADKTRIAELFQNLQTIFSMNISITTSYGLCINSKTTPTTATALAIESVMVWETTRSGSGFFAIISLFVSRGPKG